MKQQMKFAYKLAIYLVIILGVVHMAATPLIFQDVKPSMMWFISMGLQGVVLGLLNLIFLRTQQADKASLRMNLIANAVVTIFVLVYAFIDHDIQSYVAVFLFLGLSVTSILNRANSEN